MTLLSMDSFDWDVRSAVNMETAVPGTGRRGGGGLHYVEAGTPSGYLQHVLALDYAVASPASNFIQFALRMGDPSEWTTRGISVLYFVSGPIYDPSDGWGPTGFLKLVVGDNRTLELWRYNPSTFADDLIATTPSLLGATAYTDWVYLELKITWGASGAFLLKSNGSTVINLTGFDTLRHVAKSNTCYLSARFYETLTTPCHLYFDDVICMDSRGTINNDFLGDRAVRLLVPNGNTVHGGWSVHPSGGPYHSKVDEIPDNGDTDYVYDSPQTAGDYIRFYMGELDAFALTDSIPGMIPLIVAKQDTTPNHTSQIVLRMHDVATGADNDYGPFYLADSTAPYDNWSGGLFETSPFSGTPWTVQSVLDTQVGVYCSNTAASGVRITAAYTEIIEPPFVPTLRSWAQVIG